MPQSYPITGSKLYITITAAKDTQVDDITKTLVELDQRANGKTYQLFDADKITGPQHIYYAAANAQYAMENKSNISNKLDVETLLYASTQNQISTAIKMIGLSSRTKRIAVAVISEVENDPLAKQIAETLGTVDDRVLEPTPEKYMALKKLYDISDIAIETIEGDSYKALTSLITEKSTLISLRR